MKPENDEPQTQGTPPAAGDPVRVSLRYTNFDNAPTIYSNQFLIQRTEHEITLYFLQTQAPPFLEGREAQQLEELQREGVETRCIAKVVVAASFLPILTGTIINNLVHTNPLAARQIVIQAAQQLGSGETANE